MGREIRKVTPDWRHPRDRGRYIPLLEGYIEARDEFLSKLSSEGYEAAITYHGIAPNPNDYMLPFTPESEKTHFMMYEDTSEGTPISPAFETVEEVAQWCTDNKVSYFADNPAPYETWLYVANGGWGGVIMTIPKDD